MQYSIPFKGYDKLTVEDDSITLSVYLKNCDYRCIDEKTDIQYKDSTIQEMTDRFNRVIKEQRIFHKANCLVLSGKFIAINPALRSLGFKI